MTSRRSRAHQTAVLNRRRSNAATPIPAKKVRRRTTRAAQRTAAIADAT